ncbi:MAG: tRNA (N(6)-L-threonylcarbamoyladenosine(37)-C(2))-methylthiotransferase MtaB [Oscillospiraceae bacterium]|nr:tRNA (N(6)-L-threonylcarbamoyladenosine(37)-C(2))-methylthiotransferase MtaB [Oscillospiraceae bacterium]
MKFKILTLGCKVNQAESSGLAAALCEMQMTEAERPEDAGLLIVNSCAVTAESVRKTGQLLRSLRRKNPHARLVLTGCWPQAFPEDDFSAADFVTGTKNREAILEWIAGIPENGQCIFDYGSKDAFSSLPCADTTRTRAFLKIQDGCNQFCSYCIIPYARGRCRSMPPERFRSEIRTLAEQGFREIVLTGINLCFYGTDTGQTLADAVDLCAAEPGFIRIRLGSLEPERMDSDLLRHLAECEKFCPQFHLSLQSGSDSVLKRMNRHYNTEQYRTLAAEIHRLFPDAALTTDVIVGFPGETEEDFANSCRFVQEIGFAKVHVFPYSQREGTKAAAFPDQVPQTVKAQRSARLTAIANGIRRNHLANMIGQTAEVLVEGEKQQNAQRFYQGHTPNGTLVKIFPENDEKGLQNSLICVTIEEYEDDCVIGRPKR